MAMQSFLSNRPVVSGKGAAQTPAADGFQQLFDGATRPAGEAAANARPDAPQVDVIEENGRVTGIVVTCRCCERIEIACQY